MIHISGVTAINHELQILEAGNASCQRKKSETSAATGKTEPDQSISLHFQ